MGYKVAIIGAGPAGCTLGRLLTKNTSSNVTVYEAEASINARSQGGTLDLRSEGGLRAVKEAGLWDEFQKYARYDGESLLIADKNLKAWVKVAGSKGKSSSSFARPEIDRHLLRTLLKDSLPEGLVQWGHKLIQVQQDERNGRYILHFADGSTARDFDLVVGADGAWSKARAALTDVRPYYYGISYASLRLSDVEKRYPDLYEFVNRGSVFTYSDGRSATLQYMSDGSLSLGVGGVLAEDWLEKEGVSASDPAALKAVLLQHIPDWHPLLRKSIECADEEGIQARPLYMLPLEHTWKHRMGCTLIGDAAHLMTPYAGLGVNIAMQDAVLLCEAVRAAEATGSPDALDTEIQRFEQDMFVRMAKVMEISWYNCQDMLFAPDAPRSHIDDYCIRIMRTEVSPLLASVYAKGIQIYYFFLRRFQ